MQGTYRDFQHILFVQSALNGRSKYFVLPFIMFCTAIQSVINSVFVQNHDVYNVEM